MTGFEVVPKHGRGGIVEDVRCFPPDGRVRFVVVRADRRRPAHRRLVAVEDVAADDPWREQLFVHGSLRRCARRARKIDRSATRC